MTIIQRLSMSVILCVGLLYVNAVFGALTFSHPDAGQEITIGVTVFNVTGGGGIEGTNPVIVRGYKNQAAQEGGGAAAFSLSTYANSNGTWETASTVYSGQADDNGWIWAIQTDNQSWGRTVKWKAP